MVTELRKLLAEWLLEKALDVAPAHENYQARLAIVVLGFLEQEFLQRGRHAESPPKIPPGPPPRSGYPRFYRRPSPKRSIEATAP